MKPHTIGYQCCKAPVTSTLQSPLEMWRSEAQLLFGSCFRGDFWVTSCQQSKRMVRNKGTRRYLGCQARKKRSWKHTTGFQSQILPTSTISPRANPAPLAYIWLWKWHLPISFTFMILDKILIRHIQMIRLYLIYLLPSFLVWADLSCLPACVYSGNVTWFMFMNGKSFSIW